MKLADLIAEGRRAENMKMGDTLVDPRRAPMEVPSEETHVREKIYVTAKEIVIPAGTPVQLAPSKISRFVPYAGVLLGVTDDSTAEWTMPLDEALENGLIKETEK